MGLGQYEQAFRNNNIDAGLLPTLTENDLRELGVASLGHRKRLLTSIATLAGLDEPHASSAPRLSPSAWASQQAERRQLTVMFVDLVGSTAVAERLDPEELRSVMHAYQRACEAAVWLWEGHVAKYLGDGLLAYFGWPQAREDAAERAVRAGLDVVAAVGALAVPTDEPLAARVGIATGLAVIGDLLGEGAAREEAVIGEVAHVAARLQQLARPGSVVIADSTRRLVGEAFDLASPGEVRLRGFSDPMRIWQVAGRRRTGTRFEARLTAGLTALVGRDREVTRLVRCWKRAQDGRGEVVHLQGEPGVGKSRIIAALRERLGGTAHLALCYQCSPQHAGSALHPILTQFEQAAGFSRDDAFEARLDKLEALFRQLGVATAEIMPLMAPLLGLATGERYPSLDLSPQQRKEKTLEMLVEYLLSAAGGRPLLLIFEDLHWIDPTSLEVLRRYVDRVADNPVLAVLTSRPDFATPWTHRDHVRTLRVDRLDRQQSARLAERVSGRALPAEVLDQIVGRTDGVPLFIEELTRTILESGLLRPDEGRYVLCGPLPVQAIPLTLQDSLMARLDRLGPAREIAQIAACLGREFYHDLLAAVAGWTDTDLQAALAQLAAADLVLQAGATPVVTYAFRHALVQEAAYESLLRSHRQGLHARIAATIEEHFPGIAAARPEWLAHHYRMANRVDRAAELWLEAARRCKDAYADPEAASHLQACLAMLDEQRPATGEAPRRQDEHRRSALVMLGDLASLEGDLPQANGYYEAALILAAEPASRRLIENRLHRPRIAMRGGARIAFYEHGGGPDTLLFIAPLAYGLAAFQPIVERLCQDFRIITVDSRGVGASDPLIRPYPLSEHAADVRAVIKALGGGPVIGVGLSRGANLLFKLAWSEPRLFTKLVTIGGFPGAVSPPLFSRDYLVQCKALFESGDLEGIVRVHTSFVFSEPATRDLQDLFVRNRLQLPRETMLSFFDPDPTLDVTPVLGEIAIPVLVTHGGADRMIHCRAAEIIAARLPDAKVYFFRGKGHMPVFTATDEFCAVLRDFIRGDDPSQPGDLDYVFAAMEGPGTEPDSTKVPSSSPSPGGFEL